MGCGGGQGGKCTSWICPICRPGIASNVEYAAVAIVSKPDVPQSVNKPSRLIDSDAALTSRIVASVPLPVPRNRLPDLEHDDAAAQRDREPSAAARQAPDPLSELQFSDLLRERIIPENDLIGRVARAAPATDEEEQRRRVQRHYGREGSACDLCKNISGSWRRGNGAIGGTHLVCGGAAAAMCDRLRSRPWWRW